MLIAMRGDEAQTLPLLEWGRQNVDGEVTYPWK
jgi:hypothetical protein